MCEEEVVGDWYRNCEHFVKKYDTGKIYKCENEFCGLSEAHVHTARNCSCPKEFEPRWKIENMFLRLCDSCTREEFARLVGR